MGVSSNLSRRLSWLLRHGASETGLEMDQAGWAPVGQVLMLLGISQSQLEHAVVHNDKGRLQLEGGFVRACQGHSLAGTPVTVDALEASWEVVPPYGTAWHGTRRSSVDAILRDGLKPGDRTHVHLAESPDSQRGKRSAVDVLLAVDIVALDADGLTVYRAPNGVLLVRRVPPACITDVIEAPSHA